VVICATLFWPLVLPSILRKKLSKSQPKFETQIS
jgi:hypothetical protein